MVKETTQEAQVETTSIKITKVSKATAIEVKVKKSLIKKITEWLFGTEAEKAAKKQAAQAWQLDEELLYG